MQLTRDPAPLLEDGRLARLLLLLFQLAGAGFEEVGAKLADPQGVADEPGRQQDRERAAELR